MTILDSRPSHELEVFLDRAEQLFSIDKALFKKLIKETIKYYDSPKQGRTELVHLQSMQKQWYDALDQGRVDYSVYNHEYYLTDVWACWVLYSRGYLRALKNPNSLEKGKSVISIMKDVRGVLDLGNGLGYSTAGLKTLFPDANVWGTNISNTDQWAFCQEMSKYHGFNMAESGEVTDNIDLVFASEYYEHIQNPLYHVEKVVEKWSPKYFVIANSFNTISIGHFYEYYNDENELIPEKDISRLFNKKMRSLGYKKLKTRIFNDRPTIWVRDES